MIIDASMQYSRAQSLAQSTGTYYSDVLDHGVTVPGGAGLGEQAVMLQLPEALTSSGSATLRVVLQTAMDEAFSAPEGVAGVGPLAYTEWNALANAPAVGVQAGGLFLKIPMTLNRYSRLQYVIAGATMTGGKINAAVVGSVQHNRLYRDRDSLS